MLFRSFETVVARCMKERLVGGEAFAVDASMIVADTRNCLEKALLSSPKLLMLAAGSLPNHREPRSPRV